MTASEGGLPVTARSQRLEDANFERAEAAVRMEDSENRAAETGLVSDLRKAGESDRRLAEADLKIRRIEAEP